ncbi:hypothetical protein RhiirB3_450608 [Rhizophagus irregularis]|nr:hypothetical protein RhiirB3_450608 [Rhizophagus irregularis]
MLHETRYNKVKYFDSARKFIGGAHHGCVKIKCEATEEKLAEAMYRTEGLSIEEEKLFKKQPNAPDEIKIPLIYHGGKHYDFHHEVRELGLVSEDKIEIIADNMENYKTIIIGQIKFIDSCQFQFPSLEKVANNLRGQEKIPEQLAKCFLIMAQKRFSRTELPSRKEFNTVLDRLNFVKMAVKNSKQYDHAQTVWEKAECKTFGDYPDLYLRIDVLILADSIQRFRKTMKEVSGLDPLNYITLPSFAFDMAKKMTKVKLELFHKGQEDMHEFLPDIRSISPTAKRGSAWEVKLRYLENLHPAHSDYLLCPERRIVKQNELSPYQNNDLIDKLSGGKFAETEKLVATLETKDRYIIHYRNLQQYLELGMELEHVYRVLEFDQSPWLEPYITANTIRRRDAKNAFEKDLWKLMNNAVFGKTMEDQKPIYVGASILDLSKYYMYDFWYNFIKRKYRDQAKLCYTDTDSLIIEIENDTDMIEDADLYDFSDYPEEHPLLEKLPG